MTNPDAMALKPVPDCAVCGSGGQLLYSGLHDFVLEAPGSWTIKLCSNPDCKLLWLDPSPQRDEIHKAHQTFYTHTAAEFGQLGRHKFARRIYSVIRTAYWQSRLSYKPDVKKWWRGLIATIVYFHPGRPDAVAAEVMFLPASKASHIYCPDSR